MIKIQFKKNKKPQKKNKSDSSKINDLMNNLADALPDVLTGNKDTLSQKFTSIYGYERAEEMIIDTKRRTGRLYLLLLFLLILIVTAALIKSFIDPQTAMDLSRASYEGSSKVIPAEIEASFGGEKEKKNVDIVVRPKGLTDTEKTERIDLTKKKIGLLVLGDNTGLDNITSDLNFVEVDPDTGVEIVWKSNNERLIDDEGAVNPLNTSTDEEVILDAHLRLEDVTDNVKLNVSLGNPEPGKELVDAINNSVKNMVTELNESTDGEKVVLPESTIEGVNLSWEKREDIGITIQIAIVLFIGVYIYYNRYSKPDRAIKDTRDSISRDFPDFINKLILLLNAGMVVTAAFEKITEDYKKRFNITEKKYLYEEFCDMEDNINSSNSGFLTELNDIAQRSGVRDVMRFNTIIIDNIDKGSTLVDKLQSESRLLWTARIKMAEEKGRLAETKLTFPMVLQLLVLIVITIAPAVMEM